MIWFDSISVNEDGVKLWAPTEPSKRNARMYPKEISLKDVLNLYTEGEVRRFYHPDKEAHILFPILQDVTTSDLNLVEPKH